MIAVFALLITVVAFFLILNIFFTNQIGRDVYRQYGKKGEIKICYNEDSLVLIINADEDDNYGSKEGKIYYFREETPYLYFINKWGIYTVVDIDDLGVIFQTEKLNELSKEHQEVFDNLALFEDLRYIDKKKKRDAFEFGDGTIYLRVLSDGTIYLFSEKERGSEFYGKIIEEKIDRYMVLESYLYLVSENGGYYIVNVDTYEIILTESDTEGMTIEDKLIFANTDGFIAKEEAFD